MTIEILPQPTPKPKDLNIPTISPSFAPLINKGHLTLPKTFTEAECLELTSQVWDYIEDVTSFEIVRSDNTTWKKFDTEAIMRLGAGWICGERREMMAERVYEKMFERDDLHVSKEGFLFASEEFRYESEDEARDDGDLCYFRSLSVLNDGVFTLAPSRVNESCNGDESFELSVRVGDVVLWRHDKLFISSVEPVKDFTVGLFVTILPSSYTNSKNYDDKIHSYRITQTTDYRPDIESPSSLTSKSPSAAALYRHYFRYSSPPVSLRLVQLYGLIPYGKPLQEEIVRAILRGIIFDDEEHYKSIPSDGESMEQISTKNETVSPLSHHKYKSSTVPQPTTRTLLLPDQTPISGQEKYLGGIASPCGEYIYAVPGHASRVLSIHIPTDTLTFIGPTFRGEFKWLRGVEIPPVKDYPKGLCIALPSNADSILKIDPNTHTVSTFGHLKGRWMYHGGNLHPDTNIVYAIPGNASRVAKIDAIRETIEFIGPEYGTAKQKWFGGIYSAYNDCIYGIPHNASGVLKIDPKTDECRIVGTDLEEGLWKWHGGLITFDGTKIFGFPNNADAILVVNTVDDEVYTIGGGGGGGSGGVLRSGRHRVPHDAKYKYLGGALSRDGRYAYLFPCDAERVLRIDVETDDVKCIGPMLLEGHNKYQNGFCSERDGCVYGIPQRARSVIRIVPPREDEDEEVVDMVYCGDDMVGLKEKFEGGVMVDGVVYCMPLRAKGLLKVVPPVV